MRFEKYRVEFPEDRLDFNISTLRRETNFDVDSLLKILGKRF